MTEQLFGRFAHHGRNQIASCLFHLALPSGKLATACTRLLYAELQFDLGSFAAHGRNCRIVACQNSMTEKLLGRFAHHESRRLHSFAAVHGRNSRIVA